LESTHIVSGTRKDLPLTNKKIMHLLQERIPILYTYFSYQLTSIRQNFFLDLQGPLWVNKILSTCLSIPIYLENENPASGETLGPELFAAGIPLGKFIPKDRIELENSQ
jgi:hypothetical protein